MWGLKVSASGSRRRRSSSAAILLAAAALAGAATAAKAADIYQIGLPQPVRSISTSGGESVVTIGEETFLLMGCSTPEGVCLQTLGAAPKVAKAPAGGLPDGSVAEAAGGDIRKAWYARPTDRYAHGVLGDAIEAGALVVMTDKGAKLTFILPETQVFEDITPRIADLDGDGTNEVVAIRSSQAGGSAVAIFGLRGDTLAEYGASTENGAPNRWLNIAAIVPGADGKQTVYAVRTPHIGGSLLSLRLEQGRIVERDGIADDLSNHVIGSRELGMSAFGDLDGSGTADLVIPSQDRNRLRFPLSGKPDIALPGAIGHAMTIVNGRIVTATEDGDLLAVKL